ncbi:MAG: hypothetical protein GY928_16600 [Colwellia sp.]|nr:hypothetical protein [Colwellia sp.]
MSNCYISNQIADYCNEPEADECPECGAEMTISQEGGYEVLCCDKCDYKVWADGQEY